MEARRALEKLLPKEEVELLRLADESRKAEAELFEHRFKHYELEDKADALANELLMIDIMLKKSQADREYLEEHGELPPPSAPAPPP